jgi:hypothetical protein
MTFTSMCPQQVHALISSITTTNHLQACELKALQFQLPKQLTVRHARGSSSAPAGQQQLLVLRAQLPQLCAQPGGLI